MLAGFTEPLQAQCTTLDPPCEEVNDPPAITVSPSGGQTYTDPSRYIEASWSDDGSLDGASRWIKHNGTVKTSSFSYTV